MNDQKSHWILKTYGDPLGRMRDFLAALWATAALRGVLVPIDGSDANRRQPQLLTNPARLEEVNPFTPLMTVNAAGMVPGLVKADAEGKLGVLLRPCELRALVEMTKHGSFRLDRLVTITADCLGTYPAADYRWRAARKGSSADLAQETLQFARQGGIAAYRYRSACQICIASGGQRADVNIGVIGLPVRQHVLVSARDRNTAEALSLAQITDGIAPPETVSRHEQMTAKVAARHRTTRQRLAEALAEGMLDDIDALIELLRDCPDCQKCLDACPICTVDYPRRGQDGRYEREDVIRWLVSCSGCGMCEQACPKDLPLGVIFSDLGRQLAQARGYTAGLSVKEALPVA